MLDVLFTWYKRYDTETDNLITKTVTKMTNKCIVYTAWNHRQRAESGPWVGCELKFTNYKFMELSN